MDQLKQPATVGLPEEQRWLLSALPDAMLVADADSRYVDANPAAEALLGYTRAEMQQLRVSDVVVASTAWTDAEYDRMKEAGIWRGVVTLRRKDGTLLEAEAHAGPIPTPEGVLYGSVLRTLPATRTAAERLVAAVGDAIAESLDPDTLLRRLAEQVRAALDVDTTTVLVRESDDALRIRASVGLDEEVGLAVPVGQGFSGRVAERGQPLVLEDLGALPDVVSRVLRERVRSIVGVPLRVEGRVTGVLHAGSCTPRSFLPEDVALLQLVAERAAAAIERAHLLEQEQQARQQAEAAIASRDQLTAIVTHDLKSPVAAIVGQVDLLRRRLDRGQPVDEARLREALNRLQSSARRMTVRIDEMLDVARLHAGQPLQLHRAACDLVALLDALADEIRARSDRHQVRVEQDQPALVADVDAARLERAIGNVLDNALKYSPAGGTIAVRLTAEDGPDGAWAVIAVSDQGIGIPAADLPRLFDAYYRAGNVGDRLHGSGLGLASARQIVEQHGGSLGVESAEGQGTTVTLRLPLDPPPT